jgi:hypothetical protein
MNSLKRQLLKIYLWLSSSIVLFMIIFKLVSFNTAGYMYFLMGTFSFVFNYLYPNKDFSDRIFILGMGYLFSLFALFLFVFYVLDLFNLTI